MTIGGKAYEILTRKHKILKQEAYIYINGVVCTCTLQQDQVVKTQIGLCFLINSHILEVSKKREDL